LIRWVILLLPLAAQAADLDVIEGRDCTISIGPRMVSTNRFGRLLVSYPVQVACSCQRPVVELLAAFPPDPQTLQAFCPVLAPRPGRPPRP
jgi:hypothetical protein